MATETELIASLLNAAESAATNSFGATTPTDGQTWASAAQMLTAAWQSVKQNKD